MIENYFCVLHKNRRKYKQNFKLLFFKLNSHFGPSNEIYKYRKLNLFPISNIYLIVSYLEIQRRLTQTKVHYIFFYFVLKETTRKPSKVPAAKNFPPVRMLQIQLVSMNVFYFMWWLEDIIFYISLSLYKSILYKIFSTTILLFLKNLEIENVKYANWKTNGCLGTP